MSDLIEFCSSHAIPLQINNTAIATSSIVEDAAARQILYKIQPTSDAELKRADVIHYVKRVFKFFLGVDAFPYGSVPLRTYIPDGDIDLTVFILPNADQNALFSNVYVVLRKQQEEHNETSLFQIKDVQQIHAKVNIVKCIINDFVVNISFNQLGGIQKLCFIEQVDRMIGKDHLFKRSVILLKSWCYYESRILGASYGLLSTYALEILALNILQLFHTSLDGPIAVLHKFLDYYSTFDWENYCISFDGPISISSLPNMAVDLLESGKDGLLSKEFLENCAKTLTIPFKRSEINSRNFRVKCLNVIDPLKVDNNLGYCVTKSSFFRIRSAFKLGAKKLGEILVMPIDKVEDELKMFFANTLSRHEVFISTKEHSSSTIPIHATPICSTEASKMLLNLTGKYDDHIKNMLNGSRFCLSLNDPQSLLPAPLISHKCCQSGFKPLFRKNKNEQSLTKGSTQCQISNNGLTTAPQVSKSTDIVKNDSLDPTPTKSASEHQ